MVVQNRLDPGSEAGVTHREQTRSTKANEYTEVMMARKAKPIKLNKPEYFFNRELSWLRFNQRVLEQAERTSQPLLERLKFLAIFSSNLDEFFMVRVAGLNQQVDAGRRKKDKSGLTPRQQLTEIGKQTHELVDRHTAAVRDLLAQLRKHGMCLLGRDEWTLDQRRFLQRYFEQEVLPVVTPLAVEQLDPCPLLPGLQLNVALTLEAKETEETETSRLLVVPVPDSFPRFLTIPSKEGTFLVTIEDVIADNATMFCEGRKVEAADVFRLTRDADVAVQEDEASDLLSNMEAAVLERRRRSAVRVELSAEASGPLKQWLKTVFKLKPAEIYEIDGLLDTRGFWGIVGREGFDRLRLPDWPPQQPVDLIGTDSLWEAIAERDILMVHPYESFEPVVSLMQQAAVDPDVLAIKQTLYRTSGDSPIIGALQQAAENGKEVTVLVELKARFDEAQNVQWAKRLEDAGCHVIYGIVGLKTHAKALLIVRREKGRIQRYVHLATGNYNDKTAKLYSDVGMFSCDRQLATDVSAFFNLLTGFSEAVGWSKLTIAPTSMRKRFIELIDREIKASSPDRPGLIMVKVNSLEDQEICEALYRASMVGVKVQLNVRGICCLKPGIKKLSDNIEVVSILDRYLEHPRIFYFGNGGHAEIYLSSADWMGRNLDKRFELLFPVSDPRLRKRLKGLLDVCFADNQQSWRLANDGSYQSVPTKGKKIRAQKVLYEKVLAAQQEKRRRSTRFRPVRQQQKK